MKAILVLDQFCNPENVPEYLVPSIAFKPGHKGKLDAYFPEGTVFEGEQAAMMCKTGQCRPLDEECAIAAGLSKEQLAKAQMEYKMNTLGINRKEDRALYAAGVITGYDKELNYIKGPNWDKYQAAKADVLDEDL